MFPRRRWSFLTTLLLVVCLVSAAHAAELSLGGMFTDHAVIQRDKPIAVWGKATPNSQVSVSIAPLSLAINKTVTADADGNWGIDLPAMKAGGPYEITVTCGDKKITLKDILIGDVWICSGQSNMQMAVRGVINAQEEIAAADYPNIRIFHVGRNPSLKPVAEVTGAWQQVSPQTIGNFSAVGYFFGRELHKELNIPIGLVDNSWGGMPAEAYTTRATLEADPDFKPILDRCERALANYERDLAEYEKQLGIQPGVAAKPEPKYMADPGNKGFDLGYAKPDFDDAAWKTMKLPDLWENAGQRIDGAVWFRKVVTIPADWAGKKLTLSLGQIDDFDTTYFDGKRIGDTHGGTEESYMIPRNYPIPADAATAGSHVIAVRAFDHFGGGGIYAGPLQLRLADENASGGGAGGIDLTGEWRYQIEVSRVQPSGPGGPNKPLGDKTPNNPAALWNGMTEPISPYAIQGVIWYQGESNAGRAYQYRKLFPDMIGDWRKLWGDDTSFLFVQLANFMKAQTDPGEKSAWAELREAQDMALKLPRTAMATAIDVGDANDIHPKDKQTVGHRLALGALAVTYGKPVVYQGPTYDSIKIEGDAIRIKFTHTDAGLKCKGEKLTGFAIAGEDQKWYWADASIDGNTVVVKSPEVPHPVAVRYGWANNPAMSLYNGKDLPAPPFRSDDWPGITFNNK
ncbi:MAG: sialate O-acetylesterase [Phycisphaeraceae bacterium]